MGVGGEAGFGKTDSSQRALQEVVGSSDAEPGDIPGSTALRLEVLMVDGREYTGEARAGLPPPRTRPLDLLNLPDRFFSLVADGMIHYLNRSHVLHVRPLD